MDEEWEWRCYVGGIGRSSRPKNVDIVFIKRGTARAGCASPVLHSIPEELEMAGYRITCYIGRCPAVISTF